MNNIDRLPPQSVEAEQAVLGSMLIEKEAIYAVMEILKPEDFYKEIHRIIYNAILSLADQNLPVDIVTIAQKLVANNSLDKIGGPLYLAELSDGVPTAANAGYYAKIVAEKALTRQIISVGTVVVQKGYDSPENPSDLLEEAEKLFFQIGQRKRQGGFHQLKDVLNEAFARLSAMSENQNHVSGVPTFVELDKYLSGLQPNDLIIVAGRPGMGKTSFCVNIAQQAAVTGTVSAIFSLEMSAEQLVQRMLGSDAMVDQSRIRNGFITETEWMRLAKVAGDLSNLPIYIDDTPGITIMEMRAKARRLKSETNLGLIIIDYIQLMSGGKRSENRQQEISEISRSLKALARELKVPVMALSQLSRAAEKTDDKKPNLSHLRESGALEQDADIVLFIHRADYYDKETEHQGVAEIIIAKHRNGPTGTAELAFLKQFTKFMDLERSDVGSEY